MKILRTGSKQTAEECQSEILCFFACEPSYWRPYCSFSWSLQRIWKQSMHCL